MSSPNVGIEPPLGLPRLLQGSDGGAGPTTLAEHERIHGPRPRPAPTRLLDEIDRSGLRGRGGADFPTARKLRAVAGARKRAVLIVNAVEGEPASYKDRLLLSHAPHLVLDGAMLCAEAIGAKEVLIQVRGDAEASLRALRGAASVRPEDPAKVRIAAGPNRYVAGEETAVVQFLNGGPARPTFVPPRPYERGYGGRPTAIHNPETLAHVALIARFGSDWFRELGTDADPGSALVTISGAVAAPGVYEVAFGTPLGDLLDAAGGTTEPVQAFLTGGYFGTWIGVRRGAGLRLAREDLRAAGCILGAGALVALGESACGLHESARVIRYLAAESAGQCGPCVHGLHAISEAVTALAHGSAGEGERDRILRWASEVRGRGACHHPDGAARFIETALEVFGEDIGRHQHERCTAHPVLPVPGIDAIAIGSRR
jgi:NADH:ubiquinone oxidoreductase subunit F (NADH-binding)